MDNPGQLVLLQTLYYLLQRKDDLTQNILKSCSVVNRWFSTFCRSRLDCISETRMMAEDLIYAHRTFAFFTLDYCKRKSTPKLLTMKHLTTTMDNVTERLGHGYKISLSIACESGFTLETPDARICEIRFGGRPRVHVGECKGKCSKDIMSMDLDMNTNIIQPPEFLERGPCDAYFLYLRPKSDRDGEGATMLEYRVICECFGAVTETAMGWSAERMWREKLSTFQQWMITNRLRFQTQRNIQFVTDFVEDPLFPNIDDAKVIISYLQWRNVDPLFQKRFLSIFAVYEKEVLGQNTVKDVVRCSECNAVMDAVRNATFCSLTQYYLKVCDNCVDEFEHDCKCDACGKQIKLCDKHWIANNSHWCTCEEIESEVENVGSNNNCVGSNNESSNEEQEPEAKKYRKDWPIFQSMGDD